jgi:hypothetical protein
MKERMEEQAGLKDVLAQLEYAHTEPRIAGWLGGRQILGTKGVEPALRGVKTPEQALRDCAEEMKKFLKEESE